MISLRPIATVRCERIVHEDDHWGKVVSTITLLPDIPEDSLDGIETFSHLEIIFYMNQIKAEEVVWGTRHPRNNPAWPKVGIFAHRARLRPNQIGLSIARLIKREGRVLTVQGLDALDGTPVLDIKPVFREFLPREEIRQPGWVSELAKEYY
jgi:tRNA (adenine37-N6)-methyltransferase